jgi:hypothetical protein
MKALTICQPYAHLIATGQKFVENRTWQPRLHDRGVKRPYCGWFVIHAGRGKKYLRDGDEDRYPGMAFGAAVAAAYLSSCVRIEELGAAIETHPQLGWVPGHEHTEGPVLWILSVVRPLVRPVPLRGDRGLFEVPEGKARAIRDALGETAHRMPEVTRRDA